MGFGKGSARAAARLTGEFPVRRIWLDSKLG